MTKVFVSGCYDIIHAGHIEFFKAARQHGDHLTVCMASDEVYRAWKRREPALPEDSRAAILRELRCVDEVVIGSRLPQDNAFDFVGAIYEVQADVLASDREFHLRDRLSEPFAFVPKKRLDRIPRGIQSLRCGVSIGVVVAEMIDATNHAERCNQFGEFRSRVLDGHTDDNFAVFRAFFEVQCGVAHISIVDDYTRFVKRKNVVTYIIPISPELRCVDEVVIGSRLPQDNAFDFVGAIYEVQADVLASTTDDAFAYAKRAWAIERGVLFVQIPKTTRFTRVSTTEIRERLKV